MFLTASFPKSKENRDSRKDKQEYLEQFRIKGSSTGSTTRGSKIHTLEKLVRHLTRQ